MDPAALPFDRIECKPSGGEQGGLGVYTVSFATTAGGKTTTWQLLETDARFAVHQRKNEPAGLPSSAAPSLPDEEAVSPDGKHAAYISDHNLWVREVSMPSHSHHHHPHA